MTAVGIVWGWVVPYLPASVIVAVTVLFAWLVSLVVGRLLRRSSPRMVGAGRRLGAVVVGLIGGTLALQALGVNPDIVLIVIVLLGATILLALREPLGNYGARYFSDLYTPFKVGDTIQVQGYTGKVIEINAMTTVLLSDRYQLISVPNAAMIRDVVVNVSPQAWKEVTIPVTIGGNVDLPTFESDLLKSLSKLRTRLDPRFPPVLSTNARSAQSTDLILTLMLRRPEDREAITADVNQRVTEVLDRARGARR
ncbi:MAG TPA: mechanosensitive ion channel domain-containing protein [Thermoplasmata archaeon]|nr:mechanosensitive ion channel domain-containing protein [Thermoplasmata archaeon]